LELGRILAGGLKSGTYKNSRSTALRPAWDRSSPRHKAPASEGGRYTVNS